MSQAYRFSKEADAIGVDKELTPDYFAALRDQAQLADVHLQHRALCDHSQRGVEWGRWVLLHPQDGQAESGLQLWVGYVSLLETQSLRRT